MTDINNLPAARTVTDVSSTEICASQNSRYKHQERENCFGELEPDILPASVLPPITKRIIAAAAEIRATALVRPDFLHAVLCQVGLPRSHVAGDRFERRNGAASLVLEAGSLWIGGKWEKQPLPYGAKPRLLLIHLCSEAVRNNSPVVRIGNSLREFLLRLGADTGGHEYQRFQAQMKALAACTIRLGFGQTSVSAQPIERFEAWSHATGGREAPWPGTLELSQRFYNTLRDQNAVPLDPRALAGRGKTGRCGALTFAEA